MDAVVVSKNKKVLLPDGESVLLSTTEESWWTTKNGSGYVPPSFLAPDPEQPRTHMNQTQLQELVDSVSEIGVREPLTVTPRKLAPWVRLKDEHKKLPFVIVSGHRRQIAASTTGLSAIPIRVVIYKNEVAYRVDASLLNKNHADLTALEEGWEIAKLQKLGATLEELSKAFGRAIPMLYGRMNLTKLHPAIQKLLNPELPPKQRVPTGTAAALGSIREPTFEELEEFHTTFKREIDLVKDPTVVPRKKLDDIPNDEYRFEMQKVLFAVVKKRSLSNTQAMEFITEHKLTLRAHLQGQGKKPERYEPKNRKSVIDTLFSLITKSTVVGWKPDEFRRIFENSTQEEVEKFRDACHRAATTLSDIELILIKIRDGKKPMHPDVLKYATKSR